MSKREKPALKPDALTAEKANSGRAKYGPSRGKHSPRRRQYLKRKAAGLCGCSGCHRPVDEAHSYCQLHLKRMSDAVMNRYKDRKANNLCVTCGVQPQFFGVRCQLCRDAAGMQSLPVRARRVLRLFREAEQRFEIELREAEARLTVRKLLAIGNIDPVVEQALRLYAELSNRRWRTYDEVAELMHLSKERVRQLLYAPQRIIAELLDGSVPWKPVKIINSYPRSEKGWRQPEWLLFWKQRLGDVQAIVNDKTT